MKVLPNSIHLNDHTLGLYPDLKVKTTLYSILNMQYHIKVFLQQLQYLYVHYLAPREHIIIQSLPQ